MRRIEGHCAHPIIAVFRQSASLCKPPFRFQNLPLLFLQKFRRRAHRLIQGKAGMPRFHFAL